MLKIDYMAAKVHDFENILLILHFKIAINQ